MKIKKPTSLLLSVCLLFASCLAIGSAASSSNSETLRGFDEAGEVFVGLVGDRNDQPTIEQSIYAPQHSAHEGSVDSTASTLISIKRGLSLDELRIDLTQLACVISQARWSIFDSLRCRVPLDSLCKLRIRLQV